MLKHFLRASMSMQDLRPCQMMNREPEKNVLGECHEHSRMWPDSHAWGSSLLSVVSRIIRSLSWQAPATFPALPYCGYHSALQQCINCITQSEMTLQQHSKVWKSIWMNVRIKSIVHLLSEPCLATVADPWWYTLQESQSEQWHSFVQIPEGPGPSPAIEPLSLVLAPPYLVKLNCRTYPSNNRLLASTPPRIWSILEGLHWSSFVHLRALRPQDKLVSPSWSLSSVVPRSRCKQMQQSQSKRHNSIIEAAYSVLHDKEITSSSHLCTTMSSQQQDWTYFYPWQVNNMRRL